MSDKLEEEHCDVFISHNELLGNNSVTHIDDGIGARYVHFLKLDSAKQQCLDLYAAGCATHDLLVEAQNKIKELDQELDKYKKAINNCNGGRLDCCNCGFE